MLKTAAIRYNTTTQTILDLQSRYKHGYLNLEPSFRRQSVWTERDRARLIDSMLRNFPLLAIFLYKREEDGHLVFDL